jgi:hypothetical protein
MDKKTPRAQAEDILTYQDRILRRIEDVSLYLSNPKSFWTGLNSHFVRHFGKLRFGRILRWT